MIRNCSTDNIKITDIKLRNTANLHWKLLHRYEIWKYCMSSFLHGIFDNVRIFLLHQHSASQAVTSASPDPDRLINYQSLIFGFQDHYFPRKVVYKWNEISGNGWNINLMWKEGTQTPIHRFYQPGLSHILPLNLETYSTGIKTDCHLESENKSPSEILKFWQIWKIGGGRVTWPDRVEILKNHLEMV